MNGLGLSEQALVARTLAALRAQGWPTGRAVRLVADRLPPGSDREALAAVAADLEAGRTPAAGDDPFVRLLAQGERLGPAALQDALQAAEAEQSLTRVWVRSAALPAGILGAFLALLTLGSFFVLGSFEHLYRSHGSALPGTTEFLLWVGGHFRWLGPVLLVALVVGVLRLPRSLVPGVRTIQTAARLRRWAAERTTGLAEPVPLSKLGAMFGLDRYETALLGQAASLEDGARLLASELEASARRWDQRAQVLGSGLSVFVTAALVCVLVVVLLGLYLPIFSLAGAIK